MPEQRLVSGLSHLGLSAPDLDGWARLAGQVLGAAVHRADDELHLRFDELDHRVSVIRGEPGLAHLGWEVPQEAALDDLARRLHRDGHPAEFDPELARHRGVRALVGSVDPAGNRVEFVVGPRRSTGPFVSPTGARFVTGELGLGHAVLAVPDLPAAMAFYRDTLGFTLTDVVDRLPFTAWFLRCNRRHHALALAEVPGRAGLDHLMLEVETIEQVGRAYDAARTHEAPSTGLRQELGQHSNDRMFSFYVDTPSGCSIEYGHGGLLVDESSWAVRTWTDPHLWGHHALTADAVDI